MKHTPLLQHTVLLADAWDVSPSNAIKIQHELKHRVRLTSLEQKPRYIAGADISFNKYSPRVYAAFVVLDVETFEVVDQAHAVVDVHFPYIPGLLSFREIPPLMKAWENLHVIPDVIMVDGHGVAHPRRLGIATHLGLLLEKPTFGCAKKLLTGHLEHELGEAKGEVVSILDRDEEQIGLALRSKNRTKPLYISPGHLMDFEDALQLTLNNLAGYRMPEATRKAHLYVNELRRSYMN